MNARNRCWLCLACLAFANAPVLAQPKPVDPERHSYVPFEIDKNAAEKIKERLKLEKDLGPLKDILNQVLKNPKNLNADLLKKLPGMKLEDEKVKQAIGDMLQNNPGLQDDLSEWIKKNNTSKLPDDTRKSLKDLEGVLNDAKPQPGKAAPVTPPPDLKPKEEAKPNQAIAKTLQEGMQKVEKSQLGHWLRDSPAWQQAILELRTSIENPRASKWKLGDWPSKLLAPDGKTWKLGEAALERIKNMPRPDLERWDMNLSLPGLGNIPTPSLGAPSLPTMGGPSLPSLSTGVTWLLPIALCLWAGWQLTRWSKHAAVGFDLRTSLGPWPVKPEDVATRAELVQAFDYLAILTLGMDAKSWNHQAVARRWGANSPADAQGANVLARLYEQARYTDGVPELPPPQRDQARQSLLQLAEAR